MIDIGALFLSPDLGGVRLSAPIVQQHETGHTQTMPNHASLGYTLSLVESMLDECLRPGEDHVRAQVAALRAEYGRTHNLSERGVENMQAVFSLCWDRQMAALQQPASRPEADFNCSDCLNARRKFGLPVR